jgi:hypothetical protein
MKNLFEEEALDELIARMETLTPASKGLWGKMTVAQAMAHCQVPMEMALGERNPKRMMIGRILGPIFKGQFLGEKPLNKNSPTDPTFIVADDRELDVERDRLETLLRRFQVTGADGCTKTPHSFFGPLTPEQWARIMYRHVDHHLQQFGA